MRKRGSVPVLVAAALAIGCGRDAVEGNVEDTSSESGSSSTTDDGADDGTDGDDGNTTADDGNTGTDGGGDSTSDETTSDGGTTGGGTTETGTTATGTGTETGPTTGTGTGPTTGTGATTVTGPITGTGTVPTTGTGPTTGATTSTGPGPTSGTGTTTTTTTGGACTGNETFTMLAEDAEVTGDWSLEQSGAGEGMYAYPGGPDGSLLFQVDVPCDDDWYVWIRYYNNNQDDSWLCEVDGQPQPRAIVEGDCGGGYGWAWALMNWRDQNDNPCVYIEDPWIHTWDTGDHTIEFFYRETSSIARLIITNDPGYTPP